MDLTDRNTWLGAGTNTTEDKQTWWKKRDSKLAIIDQYGLIAFALSLMLVYTCMIRRFFSLETLSFFILIGMSLGNIYYVWGIMMIFTAVRYFQEQNERGVLIMDKDENKGVNEKFYLSR